MLEKVLNKLNVSDNELELFKKEKSNFNITDKLFIKNDKMYKIKIEIDLKGTNYLFGGVDLVYTLIENRKYLVNKGTKKQVENKIKKILESE